MYCEDFNHLIKDATSTKMVWHIDINREQLKQEQKKQFNDPKWPQVENTINSSCFSLSFIHTVQFSLLYSVFSIKFPSYLVFFFSPDASVFVGVSGPNKNCIQKKEVWDLRWNKEE